MNQEEEVEYYCSECVKNVEVDEDYVCTTCGNHFHHCPHGCVVEDAHWKESLGMCTTCSEKHHE